MNKATNPLREGLDNGWSVQIYDGNRRLLFSLYPSHGWAFLAGIIVGIFVSLIGFSNHSIARSSAVVPPIEAPLNLD